MTGTGQAESVKDANNMIGSQETSKTCGNQPKSKVTNQNTDTMGTKIYVLPVNSQSYVTAVFTTGTMIGFPKSEVKPDLVALLPVLSRILQYFLTTGESA